MSTVMESSELITDRVGILERIEKSFDLINPINHWRIGEIVSNEEQARYIVSQHFIYARRFLKKVRDELRKVVVKDGAVVEVRTPVISFGDETILDRIKKACGELKWIHWRGFDGTFGKEFASCMFHEAYCALLNVRNALIEVLEKKGGGAE